MASLPRSPDVAETVCHRVAPTSLGLAAVAAGARGICWLALGEDADTLLEGLRRAWPSIQAGEGVADRSAMSVDNRLLRDLGGGHQVGGDLIATALQALEQPDQPCGLPLDLRGTSFQTAVWAQLRQIPAGTVISYAELALRVGRPKAFRAVAQACGANPVGVLVPCHRVIASDGRPGGFGFGLPRKLELLRREGVVLRL